MRFSYLVCHDISDEKRLRKVFQAMRRYGPVCRGVSGVCDALGWLRAMGWW